MKEIRTEDIEKLAELSRIKVREKERAGLAKDLASILDYISEITTAIPARETSRRRKDDERDAHRNVFRDDGKAHETGVFTEALLERAPDREGRSIKVKQILP